MKFGLLGRVLGHSLSPQIHAAIFRALASALFRNTSMVTARMMTAPMTVCCQYAETSSSTRPLRRTPMIAAPMIAPTMLPEPPERPADRARLL